MTWNEVLKIISAALVSVGGAVAIFWALSSWFGKVWANKLLEKQKAEYTKDIECYKNELAKEIETYKQKNEELTYISKVQFDIEIELLKELSVSFFELHVAAQNLFIEWCELPTDEVKLREYNLAKYDVVKTKYNTYIEQLGKAAAFIDSDIHDKYFDIKSVYQQYIADFMTYRMSNVKFNNDKSLVDPLSEMTAAFKEVNKMVKEYLKTLKVK